MEMDYNTYAQLSGFSYMPAPEESYPQLSQQQSGAPASTQYQHYQNHSRGMNNMSDGLQANPDSPVHKKGTSPSEYRHMAREQRRAKEMMSRNGLYSPMDVSARHSGGNSNYYPNFADSNRRTGTQNWETFW
ncbi:hypothetical protein KR009_010779 [Drosophila setifemur]|nr:hypothetical protein KR009_010779 [Drosophila setifemur]